LLENKTLNIIISVLTILDGLIATTFARNKILNSYFQLYGRYFGSQESEAKRKGRLRTGPAAFLSSRSAQLIIRL
jgi:hypothetical protein